MNRDDIIRMAREAGINVEQGFLLRFMGVEDDLERFFHMAQAAEREACAKLCEPFNDPSDWTEYARIKADCAAAIRARGNQ